MDITIWLVQPASSYRTPIFSTVGWVLDKIAGPAVIAVLFTGLTSFLLDRVKARRDSASAIVAALRDDLRGLQDDAAEYWAKDWSENDPLIEARILSRITDINLTLRVLSNSFHIHPVQDVDITVADLNDAITGGDFQAIDRKRDTSRLVLSAGRISKLRADLAGARLKRM